MSPRVSQSPFDRRPPGPRIQVSESRGKGAFTMDNTQTPVTLLRNPFSFDSVVPLSHRTSQVPRSRIDLSGLHVSASGRD